MANTFLNRMRLKWVMATRGLKYTDDTIRRLYKIYAGHDKIIHFRDGFPVYSLSSPALFSPAQSNFFARQLYKSIRSKNVPNLMSYAVTDECNADCRHCSFYSGLERIKDDLLTLREAAKLIQDAQALGVSIINFSGGEPLSREDLTDMVACVDKDLSTTLVFTNGWHLQQRARELKKSGLDSVYVSIDSADPATHDAFRGKEGLFNQAVKGMEKALSAGLSTGISCCLTPESFSEGEFDRVVELGRKIGIHEIIFYDAVPTGKFSERTDLVGNTDWIDSMIEQSQKYNNDPGYPGILVYAYTTSYRCMGCSCGINYFYVTPYGDVCPCDFNHVIFGNIRRQPLYKIWDRMTSLEDFRSAKFGECKLKDPEWLSKDTVSSEFCRYNEPPSLT